MSVKRYTVEELHRLMSAYFKQDIQLLPIGNHELKRHQVYRINIGEASYIFKYYYQTGYANREIASLSLLNPRLDFVPRLVDHGTFDENREWILLDIVKGVPFFKVMEEMTPGAVNRIYCEMGERLKAMHDIPFDFFGDWSSEGRPLLENPTLEKAFWHQARRIESLVENRDMPDADLLKNLLENLRASSRAVLKRASPVFCHNDYNARNIMVARKKGHWRLSAVLDFEQSMPFDRAFDFVHLTLYDFHHRPGAEEAFYKGYGTAPSDPDRLRFYLLYQAMKIATWAYEVSPDYYDRALKIIKTHL